MNKLQSLHAEGHTFPIELRRHKRAKRITLRICPRDKLIRVTLPYRMSVHKAEDFIRSHYSWIEQKLGQISHEVAMDHIFLLGEKYTLQPDPLRRKAHICHKDRLIYVPPEQSVNFLKKALMTYAQTCLMEISADIAENLGNSITAFSFRDPKTRWGSCSSKGKIMLSWRLILAPLDVARYVCIHEVCHLEHMNHSTQFWKLVASFDPNYKRNRKWLKENGNQLYSIL